MKKETLRILLVGEFSGVHWELRNALKEKGIDVSLFSDGDSYKKFNCDFRFVIPKQKRTFISRFFRLFYELSGIKGLLILFKNMRQIEALKDYDVVQLINPTPFISLGPIASILLFFYLKKNNKNVFLCALGDDYQWVKYCLLKKTKYSMFDRMKWFNFYKFYFSLKYVCHPFYIILNHYVIKHVDGIIAGLYDYWQAYECIEKPKVFIPLPIARKNIMQDIHATKYPIKIFHGWQAGKELRKGNDIFDLAIRKVIEKYGMEKVVYNIVKSVPYEEYIKLYHGSDIFIDQCYSYDRGMNGLLGMSAGKVVFTGFENSILQSYSFDGKLSAINALPSEALIFTELCNLIDNPSLIDQIKYNSVGFVNNNHRSTEIAQKYLNYWSQWRM